MRTAILLRNEFIKTRRRTAFWVASLVFAGLMSLVFGGMLKEGMRKPERAFTLPGAWGEVMGGPGVLASFFAAMLLIGGSFAFAGTVAKGALAANNALVRPADAALMGGAIVGLLGWASLAFLLAITIRSSGSAIGAFFLFFIVEQFLGQLANALGPAVAMAYRFAPNAVFKALWEPQRYGVVPLKAGTTLSIATNCYLAAGVAYVVVFVLGAFLLYRRRDL